MRIQGDGHIADIRKSVINSDNILDIDAHAQVNLAGHLGFIFWKLPMPARRATIFL